jgi:hypothetical protein
MQSSSPATSAGVGSSEASTSLSGTTDEPATTSGSEMSGGPDSTGVVDGCAVIPQPEEWEWLAEGWEAGAEGDFDLYLWGGFGGSAVLHDDEILFFYQGAEGWSDVEESVTYRAIGLATAAEPASFIKDPASPVIEWRPNDAEEEGAASVAVGVDPDGMIVAFYGANTQVGPMQVNADGRWATSEDGRSFMDIGVALDHGDAALFGSGDELFPVIAFFHGDTWYVYYLPNGSPRARELGVAWGPTPDALDDSAGVQARGSAVTAWGMQSAVALCEDSYALFLNDTTISTMTARTVEFGEPAVASDVVATYGFEAEGTIPAFGQGAVLLDRAAEIWYLVYRVDDASRYDIRTAALVVE